MNTEQLVQKWFHLWEKGNFLELPLAEDFKHTSPYGTIVGKKAYLDLVAANTDKFLGHRFEIHHTIFQADMGCVRYTAIKDDFSLNVSEWHFTKNGLIHEIISYYNIEGEISEERKLDMLDDIQ